MSSKVEIVNYALAKLGVDLISSLDEGTSAAKFMSTVYDFIADETMLEGQFSSTIARASLAQLSETPAFDYTYTYQLPTNPKCLKVISVNNSQIGRLDYEINGDKLLINSPSVKIKYIKQLTDPELYDENLRRAVTAKLCAEAAYHLTGQASVAAQMMQEYRVILREARASDAQQGTSKSWYSDDLIDIR